MGAATPRTTMPLDFPKSIKQHRLEPKPSVGPEAGSRPAD